MNLLFRTDASVIMGAGHIFRCLRFANLFKQTGIDCFFASRTHNGHLMELIERAGHPCIALPIEHVQTSEPQSWLGVDGDRDAEDIITICRELAIDVVLVDHAAIDQRWEEAVSTVADVRTVVIDGQANRPHHCDLLIDPTFGPGGGDRWARLVPAGCEILSGPQFHPLSADFAKYVVGCDRGSSLPVSRILVAVGGGDYGNMTGKILEALEGLDSEVRVDAIVGLANPHVDKLRCQMASCSFWHLHVQPPDFVDLMAAADIAIGAGGTMLWERCFLRLPSVVISMAFNQERQCRTVAEAGAIVYLGAMENVTHVSIRDAVFSLINDQARRSDLIAASARIIPSSPFDACARVIDRIKDIGSFVGDAR